MQGILLEMGECKIAVILWNAVFKAGVECEVAFSQQLLLLPLKQGIFLKYLAT